MIFGAKARHIEAELQEAHLRINALVKANYTLEVRVLELETNLKTALAKIAAQEAQERELASINHKKVQACLSALDSAPKTAKKPSKPATKASKAAKSLESSLKHDTQGVAASASLRSKAELGSAAAKQAGAKRQQRGDYKKATPKRSRGFMINRRSKAKSSQEKQ